MRDEERGRREKASEEDGKQLKLASQHTAIYRRLRDGRYEETIAPAHRRTAVALCDESVVERPAGTLISVSGTLGLPTDRRSVVAAAAM
jgi:hypothetical protein